MINLNTVFTKRKSIEVNELEYRYNLSFSSRLNFGNKVIALDGKKKCLLFVEANKEPAQPSIIDLDKVSSVSVRKSYGSINQGALKTKGIEEFLKKVDLQFQFRDSSEPFVIPFYNYETDDKRNRAKLARSAKNWQLILSKIVEPKKEEKPKNEPRYQLINHY